MSQPIPASVNQAMKDAGDIVSKAINTTNLATTSYGAGLLVPQNLSPLLTNLAQRETSFVQRVTKTKGAGRASEFNLLSSYFATGDNASPRELFYADGGLPQQLTTKYANVVNPYRDIGMTGTVTGRAARQEAAWTDLLALEVKNTMQRMVQAMDWLSFWSRDDVANTLGIFGYKGLDQLITTNVIDAAGGPITKALLDKAAERIYYNGGAGYLSHIFCSAGVGIDLNNIYNTQQQLIVNMNGNGSGTDNLTLGNFVRVARTIAGEAEIVPNYFINPGTPYGQGNPYSASSGPTGVATSTVFLLAMQFINYEELLPMSKVDLAVVADKRDFMVIESGTITLRAEPFCAKIINVGHATA
jgi:hypothetical protein